MSLCLSRFLGIPQGIPPRQHSSGGKTRLSRITKRGDSYMCKLLVQGARAVIYNMYRKTDVRSEWIKSLLADGQRILLP
ncbi:transposase [Salmonella enterica]|nr:transposase [Salmonella enterica]